MSQQAVLVPISVLRQQDRRCTEILRFHAQPDSIASFRAELLSHFASRHAELKTLTYRGARLRDEQQPLLSFTAADSDAAPRFTATILQHELVHLLDQAGQVHPVHVLLSRPAYVLHKLACEATGTDLAYWKLSCNGKLLAGWSSLSSQGVTAGATISVREAATIKLKLTAPGKKLQLQVSEVACGRDVTDALQKAAGLRVSASQVLFRGKGLADDRTMIQHGISDGSTLQLHPAVKGSLHACAPRPRCGAPPASPMATFADVSNVDGLRKVRLSETAPPWRYCSQGLMIEGICKTPTCKAHGQMVLDRKGCCAWDLMHGTASCPICRAAVDPVTAGFIGCSYSFDGRKVSAGGVAEDVIVDWKEVDSTKYYRFDEGDSVEWEALVITAKSSLSASTECAICFQELQHQGSDVEVTACSHSFHAHCLSAWGTFRPAGTCPLCRQPLAQAVSASVAMRPLPDPGAADAVAVSGQQALTPRPPGKPVPTSIDSGSWIQRMTACIRG